MLIFDTHHKKSYIILVSCEEMKEMLMYHMVVEQTYKYKKRMYYDAESNTFKEKAYDSLSHLRGFKQPYPYGWIKETGTPPGKHCDVILMSIKEYELGDEIPINIIGIFARNDGDHKFIAVEEDRSIQTYSQLSDKEKAELHRLYPRIDKGEGWFDKERAFQYLEEPARPK